MRPRIGIGTDYAAAALVTLAVVALPAWAIAFADGGIPWLLVLGPLCLVLAVPATGRLVRADRLLGTVGTSVLFLFLVALATWIVAAIAGYAAFIVQTYSGLCGGGAAAYVAAIGGFAVFVAVGTWAIASPRFVVLWAMPLAPVLGFAWALVSFAVIPGGHGYCET